MDENAEKGTVLLVDGGAVMHLPRVDHDPVMFFQYQILSIDIIIHLTIDNLDKFQVIVPVAQCLPVRIPGQFSCLYVERTSILSRTSPAKKESRAFDKYFSTL